jgi:hypothetical protein
MGIYQTIKLMMVTDIWRAAGLLSREQDRYTSNKKSKLIEKESHQSIKPFLKSKKM